MKAIIIGCGKVGYTIAKNLVNEGHSVIIVDRKEILAQKQQNIDALFLKGNALSAGILIESGVATADLIICVTNSDETNILCCLTAKKLGAKHTIARVRDPHYAHELYEFKEYFGIDSIINPEQQTALEISRILRFPQTDQVETFAGGRIELVQFSVTGAAFFVNKRIVDAFHKKPLSILICVVVRDNHAIIPNGDFVIREGDTIGIAGKPAEITKFFAYIGKTANALESVLVVGGGKITRYLAVDLLNHGKVELKIIEKSHEKCLELDEVLGDRCLIIHGDGTNNELLDAENLNDASAVICLTDRDEDNVLIGLYAKFNGVTNVIIKNNNINDNLVRNLQLDSVVCPKNLTAVRILRYVSGLRNAYAMEQIKTLHTIIASTENEIEALEFHVTNGGPCIDIPLKELKLKKGVLIASIVRKNKVTLPTGDSRISIGDDVVLIAKSGSIVRFNDIADV